MNFSVREQNKRKKTYFEVFPYSMSVIISNWDLYSFFILLNGNLFFHLFCFANWKIEILTNFKLFTPQCIETISNNRSSRTIDYIIINVKIKIKIEIEKKISCVCDSRSFNDLDWIIIMMMMILSIFISYLWLYNGNLFFFLPTRTNHNDDGPKFFFSFQIIRVL